MAGSPDWKVYDKNGKYIAACKEPSDAAALVALYGNGATLRYGHRLILWTEGAESQNANNSYDYVAVTVQDRLYKWQLERDDMWARRRGR